MLNIAFFRSIKGLIVSALMLGSVAFSGYLVTVWVVLDEIGLASEKQEQIGVVSKKIYEVRYSIVQLQGFMTDIAATGNRDGFSDAKLQYDRAMQHLAELIQLKSDYQQALETIKSELTTLYKMGGQMALIYLEQGQVAGNAIMQGSDGFDVTASRLSEKIQTLIKGISLELQTATEGVHKIKEIARWAIIGFAFMTTIGTFLIFGLIYYKVIPPLKALKESLKELNQGGGDLTRRLTARSDDEVADIITEFNGFIKLFHGLIANVIDSVQGVKQSSEQLNNVSKKTLQAVIEQQSQTDLVATAITQMGATVQEVASHTSSASEAAQHADEVSHTGLQLVEQMITSSSTLAREVEHAADVIDRLGKDSENIGTVIDVIRDIAEQTNLLALNAAIEAARAGEQGRGFAVVADEVRNLANRTQQSTEEIQVLIEKLQSGAKNAVQVMDSGREVAQQTEELGGQTGKSLRDITDKISSIKDMNVQIATASEEQSAVTEEVSRNVSHISDMAHQTSENAQENETTCQGLNEMATSLCGLLQGYKV